MAQTEGRQDPSHPELTDFGWGTQLNVNLTAEMATYLRQEAANTGKSISQNVVNAIGLKKYLVDKKAAGGDIFISDYKWHWWDNFLPEKVWHEKRIEI